MPQIVLILVASIAIQSYECMADMETERLRTLVRQGWWLSTQSEVRNIWKEPMKEFACAADANTGRCNGLATDRPECGDDEFVFEGSGATPNVFLRHFGMTVCVDDRAAAERVLRSWLTVISPPTTADTTDESTMARGIQRYYRWVDDKERTAVTLDLRAKPEAGVWLAMLNLSGSWR
jgi:hypothetical protein